MNFSNYKPSSTNVKYRWQLAPVDHDKAAAIARALGTSSIMSLILAQRTSGIAEEAERFINPSLMHLHPPAIMKDLSKAAKRLAQAVREKEKIIIFGDYDADGVTATAIMLTVLRSLGANVTHYLPSRIEEGYGISNVFVDKAIAEKVNLIVTVDCGTSENENVARLMATGIDVIVTDHHEPGDQELPPAYAVLNPKRRDATYPFRDLVGAGVAFKLAWGLCEEIAGSSKVGPEMQETLLKILPFAAIGTIADVATMLNENRIIVRQGLLRLHNAPPGLLALLRIAGVDPARTTCRDIAFSVAPRLNAAGRLGEADLALNILLENDPQKAEELAKILDSKNRERQHLCSSTIKIARELAENAPEAERKGALVLAAEQLHEGVIGIVAGRMAEEYGVPCAVISINANGRGKGSARGIEGLNLYKAMDASRDLLLSFGGHEQAAGFSIAKENIPAFRTQFTRQCLEQTAQGEYTPELRIDCEVSLAEIHDGLLRELESLTPFGEGNHMPLFLCRRVRITGTPKLIGKEPKQHFAFNAVQNNIGYHAVVYNNLAPLEQIDQGKKRIWDLVFTINLNHYFTPPRLELFIQDMRVSE